MSCSAVLPVSARVRLGVATFAALCTLALGGARPAAAVSCGDDVGGLDIPCSCGDDVVSDTLLGASDPVVSDPCGGDGLVVFVPSDSMGITLNLGGNSIVGSGRGVGIRVVRGGQLGSVIVGGDADDGRAEIANFRTGVSASGRNALLEVKALDVHHNVGDGLRIHVSGVRVEDVKSESNGRDGVSVFGHGNDITGVVAGRNQSDGVQVRGAGSRVNAETSGNRRHGMVVAGRGNQVEALRSSDNGGIGIATTGSGHQVGDLQATGNGLGDIDDRAGATSGVAK